MPTRNAEHAASIEVTRAPVGSHSGVRPGFAPPLASIPHQVTRVATPRDSGAPRSARGGQPNAPSPSTIGVDRPGALGVSLADVAWLAVGPAHRQAGDRRRLASTWLSSVLDLEEPPPHRTARRAGRRASLDPRAADRESTLGCPADPRRAAEVGLVVSQSTVAKYMRRHPRPPSQTWKTFLTNHASQITAADLFVVPTVTFRLLLYWSSFP